MRQETLVPCQPQPFRVTTTMDGEAVAMVPDLVKPDFTAERPGVKFVGDITYIHTWQGFIYLATVIDCCSKQVVGWAIADHMRTELAAQAVSNAAQTTLTEPDAVFHSDRGGVYTSAAYRALVTGLGMRSSMGRTGVCWDNAMAESFFSALKNERVYRTAYATKTQAKRDVIADIGGFSNRQPWQRKRNHHLRCPTSLQQPSHGSSPPCGQAPRSRRMPSHIAGGRPYAQ